MVLEFRIIEDTFSPWLSRKKGDLPAFEEQLIEALGRAFVKESKPFVPYEQGYLESSAESVWFIEPALHHWELEIVWTGMMNPSREGHSDFVGDDGENLDYALFQYYAPLRHPNKPHATHIWVDPTMERFEAHKMGDMDKLFLEWLFK